MAIINSPNLRAYVNLIDPSNGCDWVRVFLGNFARDAMSIDDKGEWHAPTDAVAFWWVNVIDREQRAAYAIHELNSDDVERVRAAVPDGLEFDEQSRAILAAIAGLEAT